MGYQVSLIPGRSDRMQKEMRGLLEKEGIRQDGNIEYSLGVYDDSGRLLATGSAFGGTLRCFAVDSAHRGEGLMAMLVSALTEREAQRGHFHLTAVTKWDAREMFTSLGFSLIAGVPGECAFLENLPGGFDRYVAGLHAGCGRQGAVVMNANPFTLGHRHLIERAAHECGTVHVFLVSEERSAFPACVRKRLVQEGTRDIPGVTVHETEGYMISNATFPSYFMPDGDAAARAQARLDAAVFLKIAGRLGITARYLGEEPENRVTAIYNEALLNALPAGGVETDVIPRLTVDGEAVSAAAVRRAIRQGDRDRVRQMVPETTMSFLLSDEAKEILERVCAFDR